MKTTSNKSYLKASVIEVDNNNEPESVPTKATSKKKPYLKASMIEVDDDDDELKSAAKDEEDELSKEINLYHIRQETYLKLERMMKHWTSPVYAFYSAIPEIRYVHGPIVGAIYMMYSRQLPWGILISYHK